MFPTAKATQLNDLFHFHRSELFDRWGTQTLRLLLWNEFQGRMSNRFWKSDASPRCGHGDFPPVGLSVSPRQTRPQALSWKWGALCNRRGLEPTGVVLRVFWSGNRKRMWCQVSKHKSCTAALLHWLTVMNFFFWGGGGRIAFLVTWMVWSSTLWENNTTKAEPAKQKNYKITRATTLLCFEVLKSLLIYFICLFSVIKLVGQLLCLRSSIKSPSIGTEAPWWRIWQSIDELKQRWSQIRRTMNRWKIPDKINSCIVESEKLSL